MPRALLTGITGQDGYYLAEFLLSKGVEVFGVRRRRSDVHHTRLGPLFDRLHDNLRYGDVTDPGSIRSIVAELQPDYVFNLAAQSHVGVSFLQPAYTFETVANGTMHLLEACRELRQTARIYQASSSEMFGNSPAPQNEESPFDPQSPYAVAKVAAHQMCRHYRETYGMFISCGILHNHESPIRGETFVTRKTTRAAGRIKCGLQSKLKLGNLESRRDWGFAGDYVRAMWMMLNHTEPDDFVIATGESYSVADWVEAAFDAVGLEPGDFVEQDIAYLRPAEVNWLCGDASKAQSVLGWEPTVDFMGLVKMMADADLQLAEEEKAMQEYRAGRFKALGGAA